MKLDEDIDSIFIDIKNGFSKINYKDSVLYIKHLCINDLEFIENDKKKFIKKAKEKGLKTKKEIEQDLISQGAWSPNEDVLIELKTNELKNLKKTKKNLFLESDISNIDKKIKTIEEDLNNKAKEKESLFFNTAEKYSDRKSNENFLKKSLFKDSELKELFFTDEDFEYIDNLELSKLFNSYSTINEKFSNKNIKKVSICPLFKSYFNLFHKDLSNFFQAPPLELTFFQVNLLNYAKMFQNIFENYEVPEDIQDDAEAILKFVEESNNKKEKAKNLLEKSKSSDGFSFARAKRSDLERMGVNTEGSVDIHEIAKKQGKEELNMEDLLKIHKK